MPDTTTHLGLPYLLAAQAQKHVTHNEALRLLEGMVQLSVLDRTRTAPPASPPDGNRYLVAAGATGLWAGWDLNIALWVDGAWLRLVPRPGWLVWVAAEGLFRVWTGSAWEPVGVLQDVSDAVFSLVHAADPTKKAVFALSGISTGTTRNFTLPNTSSELAVLAGTQTFTGNKTFSGSFTASGAVTVSGDTATIGTATGAATYGIGTGATTSGLTKTLNFGTSGASGSTTVINIGSATTGAGGTTVVNTPTVTFADTVTQVTANQANLSVLGAGIGGAAADATNRLSVAAPASLFSHAGNSHELAIAKAAAGDNAALAFRTGASGRAIAGLLGTDDWRLRVSADGTTFRDAMIADRTSGRVQFPAGVALAGLASDPPSPAEGWLWYNSTASQLRARIAGQTIALGNRQVPFLVPATGEYVMTSSMGAVTGTQTGAAGRIRLFPWAAGADLSVDQMAINVTTEVAGALGKIAVYAADANGRPDQLILETGDLDLGILGVRSIAAALTLRAGRTYWFGLRHSSTATVSVWSTSGTADINGGAPATTARKTLQRTITYATAAPATWGFDASEINASVATAIWLRMA